jgi:hypothetical protein
MQAELHTTSPPKAIFYDGGIHVSGPGQVVVSVLPAHGGAPEPVFALNIDLTTKAKV